MLYIDHTAHVKKPSPRHGWTCIEEYQEDHLSAGLAAECFGEVGGVGQGALG